MTLLVFADTADLDRLPPGVDGFTTNPTILRRAGVADYAAFAYRFAEKVSPRPVSFEVLADDEAEMLRQARVLAALAPNVYVKLPVTYTSGEPTVALVAKAVACGVKVNVTAVTTLAQAKGAAAALDRNLPSVISVFAGRVSDAGVDPFPLVREMSGWVHALSRSQLLWASPRQVRDVLVAERAGCDVITLTPDLLAKLPMLGRSLEEVSLETVRQFRRDAVESGLEI